MPIYDYTCNSCKQSWDEFKSISNRKVPETLPCPKCGAENCVEQSIVLNAVAMSATLESTRAINKLNNASKLKDRLQHIHENSPGSTLKSASTIIDIK